METKLVASKGYHMLITTKYRVNAATWWKEGNTQKHVEGKSAETRKRVEEFETCDVFPWPQCCINP
jgi:hypothetical protein